MSLYYLIASFLMGGTLMVIYMYFVTKLLFAIVDFLD
jgi:hypothetical protein